MVSANLSFVLIVFDGVKDVVRKLGSVGEIPSIRFGQIPHDETYIITKLRRYN